MIKIYALNLFDLIYFSINPVGDLFFSLGNLI